MRDLRDGFTADEMNELRAAAARGEDVAAMLQGFAATSASEARPPAREHEIRAAILWRKIVDVTHKAGGGEPDVLTLVLDDGMVVVIEGERVRLGSRPPTQER